MEEQVSPSQQHPAIPQLSAVQAMVSFKKEKLAIVPGRPIYLFIYVFSQSLVSEYDKLTDAQAIWTLGIASGRATVRVARKPRMTTEARILIRVGELK